MGFGTNNIGELCALAICLKELVAAFKMKRFDKACVFCDSNYAISRVISTKKPTINVELILLVRKLFQEAHSLFTVELLWIKGHARVGGNARSDQLSRFLRVMIAPTSLMFPFCGTMSLNVLPGSIAPLNSIDSEFFKVPSNALRSNRWLSPDRLYSDHPSDDIVRRSLVEPLDFKHTD